MHTAAAVVLAAAVSIGVFSTQVHRDFVPRTVAPVTSVPTEFVGPVAQNTVLRDAALLLLQGELQGPETFSVDADGTIIACTEDGFIKRVAFDGANAHIVESVFIGGRPHVCEPYVDGSIVVVDVAKGLVLVNMTTGVQTIVSTISDDGIPIHFADDLVVDRRDGVVYFSDASGMQPWRSHDQHGGWLVWLTSKVDLMFGQAEGRLLKWDPATGTTTTLMSGLWFANGVTLTHEGDAVLIAETFEFRVHKYFIRGPHAGRHHVWARELPGAVDGVSPAPGGGYLITIPSTRDAVYCLAVPQTWVRWLLTKLPLHFWPDATPYGLVLLARDVPRGVRLQRTPRVRGEAYASDEERGAAPGDHAGSVARIVGSLHDPSGERVTAVTSAHVSERHGGALLLGSVKAQHLTVVPFDAWHSALQEQEASAAAA